MRCIQIQVENCKSSASIVMMAGDSTSEDFNEDQIPAPGDPDRKRMLNVL